MRKDHQHDLVYYAQCLEEQSAEVCAGDKLIEQVKNRSGKGLKSHLFNHSVETIT